MYKPIRFLHQQGYSVKIGGKVITLLDEWKDKKYSVLKIERKLRKLIVGNRWTNIYCRNQDDELLSYTKSNNQLFLELKASQNRYVSSIFNEEMALQLIREAVEKYTFEIANWLYGPDSSIGILVTAFEPIGITVHRKNLMQNFSFCAIMSLRKADESCKNRSGFFVDRIVPIPEAGEL